MKKYIFLFVIVSIICTLCASPISASEDEDWLCNHGYTEYCPQDELWLCDNGYWQYCRPFQFVEMAVNLVNFISWFT